MFERFTKEARAAVVGAQQVARDTGSRSIDTRHMLVALLETAGPVRQALGAAGADSEEILAKARTDLRTGGLDGDALAGLGIDLDAVRRQTDAVFGRGALERASRAPRGHIPFAPDAKRALQLALRQAVRLKQKSIHGSHLLLGILCGDSPGQALLLKAGVNTSALRAALEEQAKAA